jgi:hypothetical protein
MFKVEERLMVSFWNLLALAISFWRMLRASGAGTFELSNSINSGFCLSSNARSSSESDFVVKDSDNTQVRNRPNSGLRESRDWLTSSLYRTSVFHKIGTLEPIHIISVGQCRPHHFISEEILDIPGVKVSTVLDSRDLDTAIRGVPALVLTHDSLHLAELEDTCRFVRRRWPITRILAVHDDEEFLDDSLYDDRVRSDVSGRDLILRILFLVQTVDHWRLRDGRS